METDLRLWYANLGCFSSHFYLFFWVWFAPKMVTYLPTYIPNYFEIVCEESNKVYRISNLLVSSFTQEHTTMDGWCINRMTFFSLSSPSPTNLPIAEGSKRVCVQDCKIGVHPTGCPQNKTK